jgi:hypothetical protein
MASRAATRFGRYMSHIGRRTIWPRQAHFAKYRFSGWSRLGTVADQSEEDLAILPSETSVASVPPIATGNLTFPRSPNIV